MSIQCMTWAFAQEVKPSSLKFVLVALSNCANERGLAFPSIPHICQVTDQDRKTVINNLAELQKRSLIVDTGERRGRTGQVKVYRLKYSQTGSGNGPNNGTLNDDDSPQTLENKALAAAEKANSTENGTVPKTDAKSPVFPVKESRFSHVTVPKTGHGSVMDPSGDPSGSSYPDPNHYVDNSGVELTHDLSPIALRRQKYDLEHGTRLPNPWPLTDENIEFAESRGVSYKRSHERFCNHYWGLSGKEGRKLCWNSGWRAWILKDVEFALRNPKPSPVTGESDEEITLKKLMGRREAIGLKDFRDPYPRETANHYRIAQDAAWTVRVGELAQERKKLASATVTK